MICQPLNVSTAIQFGTAVDAIQPTNRNDKTNGGHAGLSLTRQFLQSSITLLRAVRVVRRMTLL